MSLHISEERVNKIRSQINKDTISQYKGMSYIEISKITNISKTALSYVIKLDNLQQYLEVEKPKLTLDILEDLYINKRKKPEYIVRNFDITRENLEKILIDSGLKEKKQQKRKDTNLKRYGSASPFSSKEVQEKSKQTLKRKYNVDSPLQSKEIMDRVKKTNLKRYGSISPLGNKEIYNKTKEQNKKNHNGKLAFNSNESVKNHNYKEIKEKSLKTIKERDNMTSPIQYNFTDKQKEILLNKENFEKYVEERYKKSKNARLIYEELDIQHSVFYDYIYKYQLQDKFIFNKSASKEEYQIIEWIKALVPNIKILHNYRQLKDQNGKIIELDIYLPDYNVAIEYNGTYWHCQLNKDKKYHYNKSKVCEENGIRLIHIFEYEWYNERQRPILENIIKNSLGINENKIFARKCKIEVKQSKDLRDFFNKNNIQGYRAGKFAICLIYNNKVVMSYIIGDCYFNKNYQYEVIRGATKLGYTIVGGASKIWNYFIKNYNPESCMYYIDYNYFNGNSLPYLGLKYQTSKLGFKNYWIEEKVVKNRQPKKHKEIKELEKQGKVVPIYNAGVKIYTYNKE